MHDMKINQCFIAAFSCLQYKRMLDDSEAAKRELQNALDDAVAQRDRNLRGRASPSPTPRRSPSTMHGNSTDRDKVGTIFLPSWHNLFCIF